MNDIAPPTPVIERTEGRSGPVTLAVAMVLTGLSAGFFFTYAASVAVGLARVGDRAYVETFQAINDTIRSPAFATVFFGSMLAITVATITNWGPAPRMVRALLVAAMALYLGGFLITVVGNVPLNEDLADVTSISPTAAAAARGAFEAEWNLLNLLRTVAFLASFVSLAAIPVVASMSVVEPAEGSTLDQTR